MSFRFQSRKVLLTYRSHIPKDALISHLEKVAWETSFIRCAHERGKHENEAEAYEHTHVLIDFGRIRNSVDARRFDFGDIHPHIDPISSRSDAHWKNSLRYIAKEDPANADLLTDENVPSVVEKVWAHETIEEALAKECRSLVEVSGAIAAWGMRPSDYVPPPPPSEWRPWQAQLLAELAKPIVADTAESRMIHWVSDETGGAGKSLLARYLRDYQGAFSATWGRAVDVLYILAQQPTLKDRTLIFDLPRRMEDRDLYSPIEDIATGCFTSTKYVPKVVTFNRGHIVVFANFLPSFFGWTYDRYDIWLIKDKMAGAVRLTLGADRRPITRVDP